MAKRYKLKTEYSVPGTYPIYEETDDYLINSIIVYKDFELAKRIVNLLNENERGVLTAVKDGKVHVIDIGSLD